MGAPEFTCPCCGFLVFDQPPGSYATCPICCWEDDNVQLANPDSDVGANRTSLIEAQATFVRVGASEERSVAKVRPPGPGDHRDPAWRPYDVMRDRAARASTDRTDPRRAYYWRRRDPA